MFLNDAVDRRKLGLKFLKAAQGLTWTIYSSILHTRLSFWMRLLCWLGTRSESPSRQSRFSELLGRKEKDDSKKQVPKSLDDFMANISSKGNTGSGAGNKKGGTILHLLIFISCKRSFNNIKITPWWKIIIWVSEILRRTVFGDWCFDNLCGNHLQS